MSFILDALKKSESDRQRQGGPALFEVKVAPPRHALPSWAVAIAVLLVANLAVVAWFLLRHAAAPGEAAAPVRAPAQAQAEPAPAAPAAVAMSTAATAAAPAATAALAATPAPRAVMTTPPPAVPVPKAAQPAAAQPAAQPAAIAADATGEASSNPDDFAPAAEPPASGGLGRVKRATDAGVPLYEQLAAAPGKQLPQLRLDLHAYAERAADRWVLINMHKLREGDSLEGVHVDRITPEGAVLSYQGSQFLLTRE